MLFHQKELDIFIFNDMYFADVFPNCKCLRIFLIANPKDMTLLQVIQRYFP